MARRPQKSYSNEDFESLEGRASKSEQKRAVQRMAALGEQLAELSTKQIQQLPVDERLIDALLDVQQITSFEARRRQFQRIGKLLRNEDEEMVLSYLTPKQGLKKQAQLVRWVDRMIEQGDSAIHDFSKHFNATEKHTLRQHVLRYHRDKSLQATAEELEQARQKVLNYVQQVALLSDQGKSRG
ncbi:ribosome biogenesis factor YjgA [Acinetobacter rathckeae]|uniref:ribosome biogenesis factor YjgA n=1 Tax=Acinetobacter rathckeae TaxID=2605272 RepID=UPI0018A2B4F8|nr:ribosome biogenesis factor YjgA [Acinetobacter rathckeae]MBF7686672.1 ribosome-associated protein [Acinetobacter rathckeae]MBF7696489.1 ribosome-associated protein [Acinetobacter rathckeae]